ncbi:hypothetical protein SLG_15800 [Sphingobium sp. SYK-6]|uniref:hypothetical protein n=1 Tax=Sphingobium sp. (strain NBRC 103272 / SYK-6) TaxID=627192 RepID=UPI0002276F53|nr:hypothetical protein [Sphingobium sp. SYK-6]BAK66255.1 hypothetical protein SLG_15800 [Sphingobium sp. SYK-6]
MFSSSYRSDKPYIPQGVSEIWDFLGAMMLSAPTFKDKTGYFPDRNIETEFFALNEGLKSIRKKVGEENYQALVALSDKMRAHFEADPEGKTGDGIRGRDCITEMEEILKASARRKAR